MRPAEHGDRLAVEAVPLVNDELRADARTYLTRTGNADLAEILGLNDLPGGPRRCPRGHKLPVTGGRRCGVRGCPSMRADS